jgi:hypothetical protein
MQFSGAVLIYLDAVRENQPVKPGVILLFIGIMAAPFALWLEYLSLRRKNRTEDEEKR